MYQRTHLDTYTTMVLGKLVREEAIDLENSTEYALVIPKHPHDNLNQDQTQKQKFTQH